jgi:hypothetical protein
MSSEKQASDYVKNMLLFPTCVMVDSLFDLRILRVSLHVDLGLTTYSAYWHPWEDHRLRYPTSGMTMPGTIR